LAKDVRVIMAGDALRDELREALRARLCRIILENTPGDGLDMGDGSASSAWSNAKLRAARGGTVSPMGIDTFSAPQSLLSPTQALPALPAALLL
jgi:hypothetical protein